MRRTPTTAGLLGATAAAVAVLSGCGSGDAERENRERPAAPIVVTAYVGKDRVSVSPKKLGAGPIMLLVTNQTDRSQQVTLETSDEPGAPNPGVRQGTGPINPRDTAAIQADVREGAYSVHVSGGDIRPATLTIGTPRPSAQQDLLLP